MEVSSRHDIHLCNIAAIEFPSRSIEWTFLSGRAKMNFNSLHREGRDIHEESILDSIELLPAALLLAAAGGTLAVRLLAARHAKTKVLGLNKVIAFTYSPTKDFDLKQLHSVTLDGSGRRRRLEVLAVARCGDGSRPYVVRSVALAPGQSRGEPDGTGLWRESRSRW